MRARKTFMILLLLAAVLSGLAAEDGPHFHIILSQNEDSYSLALFMKEYIETFGIPADIDQSMSSIPETDVFEESHPLSLRFWYLDDKLFLRSEDLRTGELYYITSAYGKTPTPEANRAWLVDEIDRLCYDLYLDGLIEKDTRMKDEKENSREEFPVIFIEKGFGDSAGWDGYMQEALTAQGLEARITENSMLERTEKGEHPFSLRFWVFPGFMEISLFDIEVGCGDDASYYIDLARSETEKEKIEAYIDHSAEQIRRLMANDRQLMLIRP